MLHTIESISTELAAVLGAGWMSRGAAREKLIAYCDSADGGREWLRPIVERYPLMLRDMVTAPSVIQDLSDVQVRLSA